MPAPKFKVGDQLRVKGSKITYEVIKVDGRRYLLKNNADSGTRLYPSSLVEGTASVNINAIKAKEFNKDLKGVIDD